MVEYRPMNLYSWDHIQEEQLNPLISRRVIHGDKMTLALIHLRKGAVVPLHQHAHEQTSIVQSGRIFFVVASEKAMLHAGDMIVTPPEAPHTVEALAESLVLDIFSPNRDDWQRGDDAYLRR